MSDKNLGIGIVMVGNSREETSQYYLLGTYWSVEKET
jgi:hypothetical protein